MQSFLSLHQRMVILSKGEVTQMKQMIIELLSTPLSQTLSINFHSEGRLSKAERAGGSMFLSIRHKRGRKHTDAFRATLLFITYLI